MKLMSYGESIMKIRNNLNMRFIWIIIVWVILGYIIRPALYWSYIAFRGLQTEATIIWIRVVPGSDDNCDKHFPQIEFKRGEETIRTESIIRICDYMDNYSKDQKITISYLTQNPQAAVIKANILSNLYENLFILIGIWLFYIYQIISYIKARKIERLKNWIENWWAQAHIIDAIVKEIKWTGYDMETLIYNRTLIAEAVIPSTGQMNTFNFNFEFNESILPQDLYEERMNTMENESSFDSPEYSINKFLHSHIKQGDKIKITMDASDKNTYFTNDPLENLQWQKNNDGKKHNIFSNLFK